MPVRMLKGKTLGPAALASGIVEVEGLPTGFMCITRHVLETLAGAAVVFRGKGDLEHLTPILFERALIDGVGRMSGDLYFCRKARNAGLRVWAAHDVVLGHEPAGPEMICKGSLGEGLRRQSGTSLKYVVDAITKRTGWMANRELFREAFEAYGNPYAASPAVLATATAMAANCDGPIIEAGCGLTTILMAAANPDHDVFCLEHERKWAEQTDELAKSLGVTNIRIMHVNMAPTAGGHWYDVRKARQWYPENGFAMGVLDGPPRKYGTRTLFLEEFGDKCPHIIIDDADTADYQSKILKWCSWHANRPSPPEVILHEGRLMIIKTGIEYAKPQAEAETESGGQIGSTHRPRVRVTAGTKALPTQHGVAQSDAGNAVLHRESGTADRAVSYTRVHPTVGQRLRR